jgi:hypothetical protein
MALTALFLYKWFHLSGAHVGACALSTAVVLEATATRFMARNVVRQLRGRTDRDPGELSYWAIGKFYSPLALTSTISLAAHPMITFFLGQSRFPLESLAVFPVITSLSFIFRSVGLSFQELPIALMGDRNQHFPALRRFALVIGSLAVLGLALIALTPLCGIWFEGVSGLSPSLAKFATTPIRILVVFPAVGVLLSFQMGILVKTGTTVPVTVATIIEVCGIAAALYVGISLWGMIGATAGAAALLFGRALGTGYLLRPCYLALRKK